MAALAALAGESAESVAAEATLSDVLAGIRRVIDVCCGKCCISLAHWLLFPTSTWILAFDILADDDSPDGFWAGVPREAWPYITYVKVDVIELSLERLEHEVRKAWGCGLRGVAHTHWSHMCDTLSDASRGKANGGRGHRYPDFSPRSDMAINHDERFHAFLAVLRDLARVAPFMCISLENPRSYAFWAFEDLHALAAEPGWRLVGRADHCMMSNEYDARYSPNKPSTWLLYGTEPDREFPVCTFPHGACSSRVSEDSPLHRLLICGHSRMDPRQSVIRSKGDKSRIPYGASHFIFDSHIRWLQSAAASRLVEQAERMPMRKVAKIIGRLISMGLAIAPSRLMCGDLRRVLYSNEKIDWEDWVRVDPAAVSELLWIASHLAEWNDRGIPIWKDQRVADVVITQDSSPVGVGFRIDFGGRNRVLEQHVPFSWREAGLQHVHREMLGLVFAVWMSARVLSDRLIQIRVDSTSTVKYVRDRAGRSEVMTYLTKKLWGILIRHRISLIEVSHIAGVAMVACGVDGISRPTPPKALSEPDRAEWQLTPEFWQWVQSCMRTRGIRFSCDRFASRANCLCARFCSQQLEPGALQPPNCFAHDWAAEEGWNWAFPPLREISRTIALVQQQHARAVLLVPDWRMHWHAKAMRTAREVVAAPGGGPFFRRMRDGQWQVVEAFVFRPLLLIIDASSH